MSHEIFDPKKYKPTGHFADREIRTFARHVKSNVLDEKEAMEVWGLNERQMSQLKAELTAAGYIVEKKDEPKEPDKATTQSLKPVAPVSVANPSPTE
jgi:hypothetical protein